MPRRDIEFKTTDHVTLRGDLYTPSNAPSTPLPILILTHGWACVKEMELPKIAELLTSLLPLAVLAYDHRGFGASDTLPNAPRQEIVPAEQVNDLNDAVTFVTGLEGTDPESVGVWGYSYGGGHAICAGAADPRVKVVVAAAPVVSGMGQAQRVIPLPLREPTWQSFAADRKARLAGGEVARMPVVTADPGGLASMGSREAYAWFSRWDGKCSFVNELTVRSSWTMANMEPAGVIQYLSPRALLMLVPELDCVAVHELATEAFAKAREPKRIEFLPKAGHFDIFDGPTFDRMMTVTADFLKERLLS